MYSGVIHSSAMSAPNERLATALAGRYRVDRELGAGGMATVYLAEDLKHHRKVAIKVLREDLAASVGASRFLREIEIAAQLQHPNILPLLDSGNAEGLLYYVMPYVEGQSLRMRLTREGELPVGEAIRLLIEIVDALAYAHVHGVVHRDIKPDNVMLSGRHALITDFGVARAVSAATGAHTVTSLGIALGTPAYMSPEQATADLHIDHRADLYAVGVVAYELLAGRTPFAGITPQQVLAAHVTETPEPVAKHRPGVSPMLDEIIMKCLAKRPADRWQSADELLAQLEPLATPSGGTQPTVARLEAVQKPRTVRRLRIIGVSALGLLALVLVTRRLVPTIFSAGRNATPFVIGNATQLTSEDGLEIHPAISPDGKFVAYAAGKATQMRIFIRPVTGGRTIALSEDSTAFEFQPRWSPDGTHILYMTPDGAFVASALGGTARRVASKSDAASGGTSSGGGPPGINAAAWSPDGQRIVIARGGSLSIRSIDDGEERVLASSRYEFHSCDWSPDGKWIACVSGNWESVVPGRTFGNIAPSAIVLVPAAGGAVVEITDRTVLNQSPVWSPDGTRLYFVSNRQGPRDIYAVEISANGRARGAAVRVTTGLGAQSIALSADRKHLVYVSYAARANIWSLPIPTGGPVDVAIARPVTTGNQVVEAMTVSPDDKWLLYDSNQSGNADIFRVPVGGGSPERLTTDPADDFAPALSPDGQELAYHSWRTGTRDIFVQPLNGGPLQQVTATPAQESYPVWSPNGNAIAFYDQLAERGVSRGLFVVSRDPSGRWGAPVARRAGTGHVSWSPDGRFIAYPSDGTVEVIAPDSGAPRVVYAPGTAEPRAENVLISKDSRTLYFKSHDAQGRASIWSVPVSGGRPRLLVRFTDPSRPSIRPDFAAGAGRFFFTIEDRQSDIWVAEITKR
jgi:eukaryotic-like serine/threonine-protein kinase